LVINLVNALKQSYINMLKIHGEINLQIKSNHNFNTMSLA